MGGKKQSNFFRIPLKSYFQIKSLYATLSKKEQLEQIEWNPYLALLDLSIKKFATFNYDVEIERALLFTKHILPDVYKHGKTCEQIIKESKEKSFSQKKDYCQELAEFSISRNEDYYNAVFHCHGRVDDAENCIISEEDYQKWYLRENEENCTPFRQTLEITLGSNPILFMGFSLNDPDFMRILRRITANRPLDKTRNPLFCLHISLRMK